MPCNSCDPSHRCLIRFNYEFIWDPISSVERFPFKIEIVEREYETLISYWNYYHVFVKYNLGASFSSIRLYFVLDQETLWENQKFEMHVMIIRIKLIWTRFHIPRLVQLRDFRTRTLKNSSENHSENLLRNSNISVSRHYHENGT